MLEHWTRNLLQKLVLPKFKTCGPNKAHDHTLHSTDDELPIAKVKNRGGGGGMISFKIQTDG